MTMSTSLRPASALVCTVLLFSCSAESLCAADEPADSPKLSPEKKKLAADLFAKIKASREKLRSGIFEANETIKSESRKRGKRERSASIFCAFDYEKDLLRYDYVGEAASENFRSIRTAKMSARYSPETRYLKIMKPDGFSKYGEKPRDIRRLGIGTFYDNRSGDTFEKLLSALKKKWVIADVRKEKNGQYRLVLRIAAGKSSVEDQLWIDVSKGYVPVRYQRRYRKLDQKSEKWSKPIAVTETKWSKQSGLWVPESIHGTHSNIVWDLHLKWHSVNKAVPELQFQVDGLNPKPGTTIVDVRSGKPVIVRRVK